MIGTLAACSPMRGCPDERPARQVRTNAARAVGVRHLHASGTELPGEVICSMTARFSCAIVAILGVVVLIACGGGGSSSSSSPTAPTATTPQGCSGSPVNSVKITISSGGGSPGDPPIPYTFELAGETHSGQVSGGQAIDIVRNFVPCDYTLTGQMSGRTFEIRFGNGRTGAALGEQSGGVERGSIVVEEGPNPTQSAGNPPRSDCLVNFKEQSPAVNPPFNFRIRFRITPSSNACGS